ncbi:MAG: GGDEF domain-containing protein [Deltaproteobacteria bacterium]|nr:GGDEF domain-containing protein [Deltaproteobacteria bacterium]
MEAFEKLYRYARSFELIGFGEIAVFLPSFLAIGFVLYSLRRIEELKSEIIRRRKAENKLQKSERMYKELSITDALTQLYHSRYFYSKLDEEIYRSVRYKHPLSLLLIDIDNFKALNDIYGYSARNRVRSRLKCRRKNKTANINTQVQLCLKSCTPYNREHWCLPVRTGRGNESPCQKGG